MDATRTPHPTDRAHQAPPASPPAGRTGGAAPARADGLDFDSFAILVRRVVDAASVLVIDRRGTTVLTVGDEIVLGPTAEGLWGLPTGQVLRRSTWEFLGIETAGDWLVAETTGPGAGHLLVVVGVGESPSGEAAVALDLLLSGASERRALLDELDDAQGALHQQGATALLAAITRAQRDFILDGNAREVFGRLLEDVLELTESEYGFIGEVEQGPDGAKMLRTWAITNIAWTDELREWFDLNEPGGIEFTNLETLFGAVITSGAPVVANLPSADPRSGGLPDGHPPLDAFVGLPFMRGDELVGMVGLANRSGGYSQELIDVLDPFITTCSTMVEALRTQRDRGAAEARHRMSEARTNAILESVVDAVVVIDEWGSIETFNHAAERTFGHAGADVLGQHVSVLMEEADADDPVDHLAEWQDASRTAGSRREVVGRRRDGSTFPLELSVSEVQVENGRMFAGTCRDLTDKQAADRTIQMYAATIEATSDFVGVARADGQILAMNKAGRALVGMAPDDPIEDLIVGDIHAPWSRDLVQNVAMPTAIAEGSWSGETAFVGPDGAEIPMSQVIVVSADDDGEVQHVSTIARDITELKEVERVKSEFVSTVSHELRTPLTSIRGSLGLLAGGVVGALPETAAEMIGLARANTDRLMFLVNDILDFEKAQAGRIDLTIAPTDPVAVAGTALEMLHGAAAEAGVVITFTPTPYPTTAIEVDADRLAQVLVNLLGNAVKFSATGDTVTLTVEQSTDDMTTRFVVRDTGPGIPADQLETIFEPFHQVDSSDRRLVGGTGLGLAIAKHIAEAHGGTIDVESTVGVGSTFTLQVPMTS